LIAVPPSLESLRSARGIAEAQLLEQDRAMRAGFSVFRRTGIKEAVVSAEPTALPNSSYWVLDDEHSGGSNSIYEDPFDIWSYPRQIIFQLPNGLQGYAVEGGDGRRASEIAACDNGYCVESQTNAAPARVNSAACQGCHAGGLLPVADDVRGFVLANSELFDHGTLERTLAQYVPREAFAQQVRTESATYVAALERSGVSPSAPEPISRVYFGFEHDPLGAAQVAGELGVTPERLLAALPLIDPSLTPLGEPGSYIDRATSSWTWMETQCELLADARNRPLGCP
jgi:hypothetical protein